MEEDKKVVEEQPKKEEAKSAQVKKEVPEVDVVFDADYAEGWKSAVWKRFRNAFRSVRFEPDDMIEKEVDYLLEQAINSVKPSWKIRNRSFTGVIYIPKSMAKHELLKDLKKGEAVGDYISFTRE